MPVDSHKKIWGFLRKYRKTSKELAKAASSFDENVVASALDKQRHIIAKCEPLFISLFTTAKDLFWQAEALREEISDLEKTKKKYYNDIDKFSRAQINGKSIALLNPAEEKELEKAIEERQRALISQKKKVDKLEQEFLIKQDELELRIQDTNKAKSSYYFLTEDEIKLFDKERPHILEGVEKWGSISLAKENNPKITMRVSSIMHYAEKHKQFKEDIELAKQVFKDKLDAEILDRALNGTKNPVFQRGEYIGDYAVKDNKLLVEVAKAKLPETYNPKAYQAANPAQVGGTTINILSFDGVDETKRGYAKNIGVVKSVDESGRVERITQAKKMLDFYKKKGTAEIIENGVPDVPADAILEAEVVESTREGEREA